MKMEYRVAVSDGDGLEFVISDGSLDRHGTRINPKGWRLDSFRKNPIALFGHDSDSPIGLWEGVRVEKDRLIGRLAMAAEGTSARIDELRRLIEQRILRAVSVGFTVLKFGEPGKSEFDFEQQELLEVSLVSVPSNPNALAKARALNVSDSTLRMVFGEHADEGRRGALNGEHAEKTPAAKRSPLPKAKAMTKTLSQRIEDAQNELNAKRDKLTELTGADDLDTTAIDALTAEIDTVEKTLTSLKSAEAKIGLAATQPGAPQAPAVNRRPLGFPQKDVSGLDLIVRSIVVRGVSHFGNKPIDRVLDERYPGHEATAVMCRTDQTIGTTTVSGWASQIVQQAWADFLHALTGVSIYPALRDRGIGLSFDGQGTVNIPSRTAGGAGGGFVAEGDPIRVGRVTVASVPMTPKKMGVIVPFSRELAKRSNPAIEALVRRAILEDTAAVLDPIILDANAATTARPAGLLDSVAAAAVGYGGGDFQAVIEDFKALLAPFIAANAADNITVVMNPTQGLAIGLMPGGDGKFGWFSEIAKRVTIIESTHATAGRLIALRNSDFATALGDAPEFDISEQATVHMEDTSPLPIVTGDPTAADPVRSFWQTATIGVRMLMDVSWMMRRSGMVSWINGTTY